MTEQQQAQQQPIPQTVSVHLTEAFHNAMVSVCEAYGRSAQVLSNEGQQTRQMVQQNEMVRQKIGEVLAAKGKECEALKAQVTALEAQVAGLKAKYEPASPTG